MTVLDSVASWHDRTRFASYIVKTFGKRSMIKNGEMCWRLWVCSGMYDTTDVR